MTITNTQAASAIANVIAQQTARLLKDYIVVAAILGRDYDSEDIREGGDRLTVSTLGNLVVNPKAQGSSVTIQSPSTTGNTYILEQHETTFGLDNVTQIQARPNLLLDYSRAAAIAIAEFINSKCLDVLAAGAGNTIDASAANAWTEEGVFDEAERLLNVGKAPVADRFAVLGPWANKRSRQLDAFKNADRRGGSAYTAVETGMLGMLASFNTLMSQGVKSVAGTPVKEHNVFLQRGAGQLVTRPLDTSMNGISSSVSTAVDDDTQVPVRTTLWYDNEIQRWLVTLDVLFAVKEQEAANIVRVEGRGEADA